MHRTRENSNSCSSRRRYTHNIISFSFVSDSIHSFTILGRLACEVVLTPNKIISKINISIINRIKKITQKVKRIRHISGTQMGLCHDRNGIVSWNYIEMKTDQSSLLLSQQNSLSEKTSSFSFKKNFSFFSISNLKNCGQTREDNSTSDKKRFDSSFLHL